MGGESNASQCVECGEGTTVHALEEDQTIME
jgi:hypothetical protein